MTTQSEILQATKERLEFGKTEKSEQRIAERKANAALAWYQFIVYHHQTRDTRGGIVRPYHQCEANTRIMEAWCGDQVPPVVSRINLEQAYEQLIASGQLAKAPASTEKYVKKTEPRQPYTQPRTELPTPPVHLDYTRAEILSWTANQLRRQMAVPGLVRKKLTESCGKTGTKDPDPDNKSLEVFYDRRKRTKYRFSFDSRQRFHSRRGLESETGLCLEWQQLRNHRPDGWTSRPYPNAERVPSS